MIDAPTLTLASGLDNIALALMASLYAWTVEKQNPALRIWCIARYITGIALIFNAYKPQIHFALELGYFLVLLGLSLELAACLLLLNIQRGLQVIFVTASASMMVGRLLLPLMDASENQILVYQAFCNGSIFFAISLLLMKKGNHHPLCQWMSFSNGLVAFGFFLRVGRGLLSEQLIPFFSSPGYIQPWMGIFLVTIVNGFGFLLLVKQYDDEKLRQALADVAAAEEEQRQLISLASHEFRTPSAIIKSSLDSLNFLGEDVPPHVALRLVNIHKATQRMTHLANTLIAQDRLRHLRFDLIARDIELSGLIRSVAATYVVPLVLQGVEQEVTVRADPDLLVIALHNLIDNALRHSPENHPPEIHLCLQRNAVEIRVSDQGKGVPDQEKQAIFERFYRSNTDNSGSGLGLSIVHKIISLHQGSVWIGDNLPQGAVFFIQIPRPSQDMKDFYPVR